MRKVFRLPLLALAIVGGLLTGATLHRSAEGIADAGVLVQQRVFPGYCQAGTGLGCDAFQATGVGAITLTNLVSGNPSSLTMGGSSFSSNVTNSIVLGNNVTAANSYGQAVWGFVPAPTFITAIPSSTVTYGADIEADGNPNATNLETGGLFVGAQDLTTDPIAGTQAIDAIDTFARYNSTQSGGSLDFLRGIENQTNVTTGTTKNVAVQDCYDAQLFNASGAATVTTATAYNVDMTGAISSGGADTTVIGFHYKGASGGAPVTNQYGIKIDNATVGGGTVHAIDVASGAFFVSGAGTTTTTTGSLNSATLSTTGAATIGTTLGVTGLTTMTGGAAYFAGGQPEALFSTGIIAHAGAAKLGGYGLPGLNSIGTGRAFAFTAMTGAITTASSSGTGSEVVTVTDGTNTCTFTLSCTTNVPSGTNSTGAFRVAAINGAGTGCVYAAGAGLTASVTTACGTSQPSAAVAFEGTWQ